MPMDSQHWLSVWVTVDGKSCKYDLFGLHLTFSLVLLNFAAAVRAELRDGSACGEWRAILSQRHPVYISGNEIYYSYSRLKRGLELEERAKWRLHGFFSPGFMIK